MMCLVRMMCLMMALYTNVLKLEGGSPWVFPIGKYEDE